MHFNWPLNTPLEVYELVQPARFNEESWKYRMPFFWSEKIYPATISWRVQGETRSSIFRSPAPVKSRQGNYIKATLGGAGNRTNGGRVQWKAKRCSLIFVLFN